MRARTTLISTAALAGALACLTFAGACSSPGTSAPPAAQASPDSVIASDLPPLPPGIDVAARPAQVVKAAYEFAARHPDVLEYIPCFCGCERGGHRGNEDCFVKRRDSAGRVSAWEPHGMACEICVDVATMAMELHNSGASTWQIRQAIEHRFASPDLGHTPTPMPPQTSGD